MAGLNRLDGKVAVVTGAGRGIGRAIAIAFADEGAAVVAASRTPATVETLFDEIAGRGGRVLGVACDVSERTAIDALVQESVDAFGTIDIVVNNAQSYGTPDNLVKSPDFSPLETYPEDLWEYTFRTGLKATLWTMQAAFPYLKTNGGKVINFGSATGQQGREGMAGYNANKEAIRALSRTAAREWGKYKINVNVINPGILSDSMKNARSQRTPEQLAAGDAAIALGSFGLPEDAAALAVFLASNESDFITGQTLEINGGNYLHA